MNRADFDGGGDPTTRHWYQDRPRFCRQPLSPYEMGLFARPPAPGEVQRHPSNAAPWELPTCQEPIAPGYNPLLLCACHLALAMEARRQRGEPIMPARARGGGLVLDFVENEVYTGQIAAAERERRAIEAHAARLAEAHQARIRELEAEAQARGAVPQAEALARDPGQTDPGSAFRSIQGPPNARRYGATVSSNATASDHPTEEPQIQSTAAQTVEPHPPPRRRKGTAASKSRQREPSPGQEKLFG